MTDEIVSSTSPQAATPPQAARDDTLLDPRRWLAFGVVLVAGFMDLVDSTIVNVSLPSIQRDLHAEYAQLRSPASPPWWGL